MISDQERALTELSAKQFAAQIGLEYFDSRTPVDVVPLLGKLTNEGMAAYGIVPIALNGTNLTLGISEDTKRDQLDSLKARLTAYQVTYKLMSRIGWQRLLHRFELSDYLLMIQSGNYGWLTEKLINAQPKEMFEPLAQLACTIGASDIHLEPGAEAARIRLRIDGTLQPILELPRERYDLLTSDLQLRAGAKWNADLPQSGRISVELISNDGDHATLNMRLETIPSLHGQDVVIRLFNLSIDYLKLDNLELTVPQRESLVKVISHPRGLVLTVGPTGSGKTSTLYSILHYLNNPNTKIVTLEDPVEYELPGVVQIPVRSEDKDLFIEKLRAVLREDPNVVMIGEIRDADTAKTALQAALTGHLVLSSFHAASAASAITRLMDMNGQNPLLASALRMIVAQRLVRRLCTVCKQEYAPSKDELLAIKTALHGLPAGTHPSYESLKLYKAVGCPSCSQLGFKGRVVVVEQLEMTEKLEALIGRGTAATTSGAIEHAARAEGMLTLMQSGVLKAVNGLTTLEEVFTAVGD